MGFKYIWLPATGGDVGVAGNWSDTTPPSPASTLPGPADEADFDNIGGAITGDITVDAWVIDSGAGYYTFSGNTTATFFQVDANASLDGTWTATATGPFFYRPKIEVLG